MNKYVIRLAEAEDIERIQQLSQELMEYEKDNSTKKYMFNMNWALTEQGYNNYKSNIENDWIYVACVNNEIIGYMTCWINKKRPWLEYDVLEIGNLYIQEDDKETQSFYQKHGLYKYMIEQYAEIEQ